jgi:hypothetical protein
MRTVVIVGQAARVGLDLPDGAVSEVVTVVAIAAYYVIARWVEQYWPGVGRILVSAGLSVRQPVYVPAADRTPRP